MEISLDSVRVSFQASMNDDQSLKLIYLSMARYCSISQVFIEACQLYTMDPCVAHSLSMPNYQTKFYAFLDMHCVHGDEQYSKSVTLVNQDPICLV